MTDEESLQESKSQSCWKKRTCLEITLIVVNALVALFILGYSYLGILPVGTDWIIIKFGEHDSDVCFTPECVVTAAEVMAKIDSSVNPCEDFYKFSCGTFVKNEIVPESTKKISAFTLTEGLLQKQLRSIYEDKIKEDEPKPFALIKSLYKSCMDVENVNADSEETLTELFRKSGGWPVLEGNNWNEDYFDFKNTLNVLGMFHSEAKIFVDVGIQEDPKDANKNILVLDQPPWDSMSNSLRKGLDESIVQEYQEHMIDVVIFLGASPPRAAREMRDVLDFEIELSKIMHPFDSWSSPYKNARMTFQELQLTYSSLDLMSFINTIIEPAKKRRTNDELIVTIPNYFRNLENLLRLTPKKTVANYMHWNIMERYAPYIDEDLRKFHVKFYNTVLNRTRAFPRWKTCITPGLELAKHALYARYFFSNDSAVTINKMVEEVKLQFLRLIDNVNWMDDVTKKRALERAGKAEVLVDYPDEFQDDALLEKYYKDLQINPDRFFESVLGIAMFETRMMFSQLDEPLDKDDWRNSHILFGMDPYLATFDMGSVVKFSPGAFQGIYFENDRPKYMNYGSSGFVIGNKLTHTIHQSQKENVIEWWQPKTRTAFKEGTDCILDQYEELIKLDSEDTKLFATVMSIAAVKEAYLAYKNWTEENGKEGVLPGLNYTSSQLFWISLGNTFCSVTNTDESQLEDSYYDLNDYSFINVLAMNSDFFHDDFNCVKGSKMKPEKECKIW